jgi:hypothetical protein
MAVGGLQLLVRVEARESARSRVEVEVVDGRRFRRFSKEITLAVIYRDGSFDIRRSADSTRKTRTAAAVEHAKSHRTIVWCRTFRAKS